MSVKAKKKEELIGVAADINARLEEIRKWQEGLTAVKAEAESEIKKVKDAYAERIQKLKTTLNDLDKDVKKLMKGNKKTVFQGADTRELPNGILHYSISYKVRKAKDITPDKLKDLGYQDGIKIEESVDWDTIEKWPDEKLVAIGTERKEKEEYSYELKEK